MNTRLIPFIKRERKVGDPIVCINKTDPTLITIGEVKEVLFIDGGISYKVELEVVHKNMIGRFIASPKHWEVV